MNLTAARGVGPGFVTAWPCSDAKPDASNLNFQQGDNSAIANAAVLALGVNGDLCFEASAAVDLIADLNGWFAPSAGFEPRTPRRILDTRTGLNLDRPGALVGGDVLSFDLTGLATSALVLNVTSTRAQGAGFVTVWPCNAPRPDSSNLNFEPGRDAANGVIVPVGANRICFESSVTTDLVVDLNGFFQPGAAFAPRVPRRVFDTRNAIGGVPAARLEPGRPIALPFPAGVAAVSMNVTATGAEADGFITVWPCSQPKPDASNINYRPGNNVAIANTVIVPVGAGGLLCFDTFSPVHLIADFNGFFPG